MALVSLDQFGKNAVASGLFAADELKRLWTDLPATERPKDGEAFAARLVADGKLNRFQADELLSNRQTPLVLGDYLLVAKIGAGGMGQVFKAQHRRLKRFVAVKLLPNEAVKDAEAVRRFQREVEAAGRLSHPNIVQANDAGEARGRHYLVMECVEGGDLAALVRREGVLGIERAVDLVVQAAKGLAYAHKKNVIHRDIKPANLLLDSEGTVKILDMGLARFDDSSSSDGLTGTEQVMGTVDYMSPEQAADTKHADARSDIYALGCTLWFLLTGKRLYDGDTMVSRVMKHRDAPLPSLVKTRDDASWPLEQAFHKLIAKRADERFQTMDEVVRALAPFGSAEATTAGRSHTNLPSDPELKSFLSNIAPTATKSTPAKTFTSAEVAATPTASFLEPESGTDPKSEMRPSLLPLGEGGRRPDEGPAAGLAPRSNSGSASQPSSSSAKSQARVASNDAGSPLKMIVAGIAVCATLLGGAIFYLTRNTGGDPVASATGGTTPPKPSVATAPVAPPPAVSPFDSKTARKHQEAWAQYLGLPVETTNALGMKFVLIPPGEFLMGSSEAEIEELLKADAEFVRNNPAAASVATAIRNQGPQHRVTLTKPFYLGATEVTIGQFRRFCDAANYKTSGETKSDPKNWRAPGYESTDNHPVEYLSWLDAAAFCRWLSREEKLPDAYDDHFVLGLISRPNSLGYRLPTEAEWEFANRAGTTTRYPWGDDVAQKDRYLGTTEKAVASYSPNAFSLFDMPGSLHEYCQDRGDEYTSSPAVDPLGSGSSDVVLRGASYSSITAREICSAKREKGPINRYTYHYGFRVVRPLPLVAGSGAQPPAKPPVARASGSPSPVVPLKSDPFFERETARLFLARKAELRVTGTTAKITAVDQLPAADFKIRDVSFTDDLTDDDLVRCGKLPELSTILGKGPLLSDRGMANLTTLSNLTRFGISELKKVTPQGFAALANCSKLQRIESYSSRITDDCLKQYVGLKKLSYLNIHNAILVTDASVDSFLQMPALTSIYAVGTGLTAKGVARLKAGKPRIRITCDFPTEPPARPDDYAYRLHHAKAADGPYGPSSYIEIPWADLQDHKLLTVEGYHRSGSGSFNFLEHFFYISMGNASGAINFGVKQQYGSRLAALSEFPPTKGPRGVHYAAVFDEKEARFYMDGQLAAKFPVTYANRSKTDSVFRLGSKGKIEYQNGTVDEVRVSKSARYVEDFIPELELANDAETLALYHFDEGKGDVLRDDSGHGHDGKIFGGTWVRADGTPITVDSPAKP